MPPDRTNRLHEIMNKLKELHILSREQFQNKKKELETALEKSIENLQNFRVTGGSEDLYIEKMCTVLQHKRSLAKIIECEHLFDERLEILEELTKTEEKPYFIPSTTFIGSKTGYFFGDGTSGTGYYIQL